MATKQLSKAKINKADEFYTQYNDIAAELSQYKSSLKNKHILCPCDWDSEITFIEQEQNIEGLKCNFVKYLNSHFDEYKLKSITASGYNPATGIGKKFQDSIPEFAKKHPNGVVITNPPFSQFRDFMSIIFKYPKLKFIVLGNMNAISYKEIFPMFKKNKIWFGASIHSGDREFGVPNDYPLTAANYRTDENGNNFVRVKGIRWFTNLPVDYRNDTLILTEEYTPEKYPKYDNYDAINVNHTNEIPDEYFDVMGVPISFLDKYNPKQFKIIDINPHFFMLSKKKKEKIKQLTLKKAGWTKDPYVRILIKRIKQKKGK